MTRSPAVEHAIHHWVETLAHVSNNITHCAVTLDVPHRHHQRGRKFAVRIEIAVPGRRIAVSRTHDAGHETAQVALADAFRAARRQLLDFNHMKEAA